MSFWDWINLLFLTPLLLLLFLAIQHSRTAAGRVLVFFAVTLFVSATLLFFVQPMIGKMILPILGGTPAVWNTCMVFFQAMLLVGYSYTHTLSTTQPRRRQLLVQGAVLFLPLIVLPFALGDSPPPTEENPIFWLLWLLLGMVGLPFFVVATTAPLLQKWFATTGHPAAKDPYFLYGASNFGSMLGLLAYPALIEWMWDVPTQAVVWTAGYALFIALVVGCAYLVWRTPEPALVTVPVAVEAPVLARESPVLAPALAAVSTAVTTGRRRGRACRRHRGRPSRRHRARRRPRSGSASPGSSSPRRRRCRAARTTSRWHGGCAGSSSRRCPRA